MVGSQAMERHEKVADRAGSLVTERVREVIETAQARAERVRRDAADEANRLDSRRMQAASRIVSHVEELEDTLGRLRQQMQSEHAVTGSLVDEDHLIEAVEVEEDDQPAPSIATSTAAPTEPEPEPEVDEGEPAVEVDEPSKGEDAEAAPDVTEATPGTESAEEAGAVGDSGAEDGEQRTRFSFLRRRESQGAATADSTAAEGTDPNGDPTRTCAVCGRGFAGDEAEMKSLGWVISGSGEVTCADCHSAGWLRPSK